MSGYVKAGYSFIKNIIKPKKVFSTIKSVKPTTDIKGSVKRVYRDVTSKRIDDVSKAENKLKKGREMMKEAQKERKKLVDTGRAFQFKHTKSIHAVRPGENPKVKYKGNLLKEEKPKKFKKGKELDKEK